MPRPDRRPAAPGRFVEIDGQRIHLVERGRRGPLLLLLHGYLASQAIWQGALDGLADRCRVKAIDLPGSGYSDRPAAAPYDLPWFADRVLALADALGAGADAGPLLLGGHSLGGAVALHAAVRRPERVAGLVLVAPFVYAPAPPPGLRLARRWPGPMRRFFRSPIGRRLVASMVRRAVYTASEQPHLVRANARRLLDHLDAAGGWHAATRVGLQAHEHCPGPELAARVRTPSLICWGLEDRAHDPGLGARLRCDLAAPSRLVYFPGAAHNCHEEQPRRFCAEVGRWLQELEV